MSVCLCVHCVCPASCMHVALLRCMPEPASLFLCVNSRVFSPLCVYAHVCVCVLLAWRAMPQGAWAASEGPVCPQSLTICALLVVIKVSNLEVSWGLAKRGQKMSLRRSSCWAAVTIFTYLYTLIVFALPPWHWDSQSLARDGEGEGVVKGRRTQRKTVLACGQSGSKVDLNEQIHRWADQRRLTGRKKEAQPEKKLKRLKKIWAKKQNKWKKNKILCEWFS